MTISVRRHANAAGFLDRAQDWLLASEAEYNLVLGLAADLAAGRRRAEPTPYLATLEHEGRVVGCALRTPPHKLALTHLPAAAAAPLAAAVFQVFDTLPAVLGPATAVEAFAAEWSRVAGVVARPGRPQRIYRLDRVVPPTRPAPGAPRRAEAADEALLTEWLDQFMVEADVMRLDAAALARDLLNQHAVYLWQHDGPVSLVGNVGWTPHGVRIGFVYTPSHRRGRGYASTLVAWLSQQLLDSGRRFCFLYTDLANPTSNAIYQRLGYQPVADVVDYLFEGHHDP